MYVIIETGAKQYKVKKGDIVLVETLPKESKKSQVVLSKVLLATEKNTVLVGQPYLKNVEVLAEHLGDIRAKKIRTYKYKRRKNSHKTIGHRQNYSRLRIEDIKITK